MKVGIYISGLGQSFATESIEKYTERLKNEMDFSNEGVEYEVKKEKIKYTTEHDSVVMSICEKGDQGKVVYKIYDFNYHEILTEKFNSYSMVLKNLWLLTLVLKKTPLIIKRLFIPANYNRPGQTLFIFIIFFIISFAILLMLPATFALISDFVDGSPYLDKFKLLIGVDDIKYISKSGIKKVSEGIVSITALFVILVPNANLLITNLATEFVSANDYIEHGAQRQLLQGNLDLLVNHITNNEKGCKIHFHAYSFGCIIALDYVYPYGNKSSKNAESCCEALITIGAPYEFIKSYYPQFYDYRKTKVGDKMQWLNIYSISDALATNFRRDATIGIAEFGIDKTSNKPLNINYEVTAVKKTGLFKIITLYGIKMHDMYWDTNPEGQSCLRLIYQEMNKRGLI